MSLLKHEINKSIRDETSLSMKPKLLYNDHFQKIGKYCPCCKSVRTQMMRTMNKHYPINIKTFEEIPGESIFFKTLRDEVFMIFKNSNVVIFQSPFQAKIYSQYSEDIFVDGTFSTSPKFSYQVFITRNYRKKYNCFYITSISLLKNKKQANFIK